MSDSLPKTLRIVLALLLAISVGLTFWFYYAAQSIDSQLDAETQIEQYGSVLQLYINWAYLLISVAGGLAVFFAIKDLFTSGGNIMRTLTPIVAVALVILVAYFMSSNELLSMPNYDGADNVPDTLKFAGASLYTVYFLAIGAVGAIVSSEIYKIVK